MKIWAVLLCCGLFCGCSSDEIVLTADNEISDIAAVKGQKIVWSLPENPSTGYTWNINAKTLDKAEFEVIENKFVQPQNPMPGKGGERLYKIKLLTKGKILVEGKYFRQWEKFDREKDKFFATTIYVE